MAINETISLEVLEEFQSYSGYNLPQFYTDFEQFMEFNSERIKQYYSGVIQTPHIESFEELSRLLNEVNRIMDIIQNFKHALSGYRFWILIEQLEEIRTALESFNNMSRLLRSSISQKNFGSSPQTVFTLKANQTLEDLTRLQLGSDNPNDDWGNIAYENNLNEEEYTPNGGTSVSASFENGTSIFLTSVVDNLTDEKIYGKDIDKKFVYENDDLKVLSPENTLKQSINILMGFSRRDNPQYPELGLDKTVILGGNIATLTYNSAIRQITEVFQSDDTIRSVTITDISRENTSIRISANIETVKQQIIEGKGIIK